MMAPTTTRYDFSALDRADLIEALQDACDELSERAHGKYADYEPEDLPEIDAKLERWTALIDRLGPYPDVVHD